MLKVLRMHRDEVDAIDEALVPGELLAAAAPASWDEAVELGEVHGVRNSQASVLAPTGCLVGGVAGRHRPGARAAALARRPRRAAVAGPRARRRSPTRGPQRATQFYVNGLEPVVDVDDRRGYRIQGTTKHRVKVVDRSRAVGMAALRRPAPRRHGAAGARPAGRRAADRVAAAAGRRQPLDGRAPRRPSRGR